MSYIEIRDAKTDKLIHRSSGDRPHFKPRVGWPLHVEGFRRTMRVAECDRLAHGAEVGWLIWVAGAKRIA